MKKIMRLLLICVVFLTACINRPTREPTPQPLPEEATQPKATRIKTVIPINKTQTTQSLTSRAGFAWKSADFYQAGLIREQQSILAEIEDFNEYHLQIKIAEDFSGFEGKMDLRLVNQETIVLDDIYFHLYPNYQGADFEIAQVLVDGNQALWSYLEDETILLVKFSEALAPGQERVISLDFVSTIPTVMGGNYGLFGYFNEVLVLDTFVPTLSVYDDSGWHADKPVPVGDLSYSDAAFYLVEVSASENLTLVTSGIELEKEIKDGSQTALFAIGPARDFYLAGSSKFQQWQGTVGEVQVNSYTFPEFEAAGEIALTFAEDALSVFSSRYGDYPYTEFDVISSPMQALGIEYPGITGISMDLYRLEDSPTNLTYLESVIAHEVGHQWFYNLVGNDQVGEPWLDESVTQFVTGVYYEDRYGLPAAVQYRASWDSRWQRVDREQIPIGMEAAAYKDNLYSPIVYGRGPYFVMALQQTMGEEIFNTFMRTYVESNQWKIVNTETFQRLAEETCACDLTDLFTEWVYEE